MIGKLHGVPCPTSRRAGISRTELLVVSAVVVLIAIVACPLVLTLRESARLRGCQDNLRQLGLALHSYHDSFQSLPPAAVWSTSEMKSLALHMSQRVDLFTRANWAMLLLPYTSEADVSRNIDHSVPVAHARNQPVRETPLPLMTCASDNFNTAANPHVFEPLKGRSIAFARGNYAINGGTHNMRLEPGSPAAPTGDGVHLEITPSTRDFRYWGNGIAGFNVSFSMKDFENGASTLVALEEVRAGIHAVDSRGLWAFGQVGGSVTWAHGVNGDDYGPNNPWPRSDDILGCARLHDAVGIETITRENMPCVSYLDGNTNATARSRHTGGANILMLDGAIKFISDNVDPGCWHVMHSRETPRDILSNSLDKALATPNVLQEATRQASIPWPKDTPAIIINSIGMDLVLIPSGEFEMGIPDQGYGPAPIEAPAHRVQITQSILLGKCEVTQKQFKEVMGWNPSFHTPATAQVPTTEDFPVEQVTWTDCQKFCDTLSALPAEQKAGRRYRLPTEAEWEYACRAGSREPHRLPVSQSEANETGEVAGSSFSTSIRPVSSFRANVYGLHDMRGNTWEWCSDWFDRDYFARASLADAQGPSTGFMKVLRGSDWTFVGESCMINYPIIPPWKSSSFVGFRVVCELAPSNQLSRQRGRSDY